MGILLKAVDIAHHSEVLDAQSGSGESFVDYKQHLNSFPPEHFEHVNNYRTHILDTPDVKIPSYGGKDEATKKLVYEVDSGGSEADGQRYMAKPYYEKNTGSLKRWNPWPLGGWAEIANQALYHAGELGEFHQKVHVAEHHLRGERTTPMVIIHLEPGVKDIYSFRGGNGINDYPFHPEFIKNTRKMVVMDFLTNNLDRHGHNLMYNPDTQQGLAVDHGRAFQYATNHYNKWDDTDDSGKDSLAAYMAFSGAAKIADPKMREAIPAMISSGSSEFAWKHMQNVRDAYNPIIENWWAQHSKDISEAFLQHVAHIKKDDVRSHIIDNFMQRKDWLDTLAEFGCDNYGEDWFLEPVQMHPYVPAKKKRAR